MFTKIKKMLDLRNRLRHFGINAEGKKAGFELVAYGASDKGLKRLENEDSFLLMPLKEDSTDAIDLECLMVVADGAGRDQRGQVASQMAVDILRSSFYLPSVETPMDRLVSGLEIANRQIFDRSEEDFSLLGMATTLTAVYVKEETVFVAHLGNSRAYLIRDSKIERLTKDHTLAEVLLEVRKEEGFEINQNAYKTLLQAAGAGPTVEIAQTSFELAPNDILVVCSDGLTSCVDETRICQIVENADNSEAAVKELIDEANKNGGHDNITAVVAKFRPIPDKNVPFPV